MKSILSLTVVSLLIFQTGCLRTRAQLRQAETQTTLSDQVLTLEQKQAAKELQVDQVNQSISELVGRVEVLEKSAEAEKAQQENQTSPEEKFTERFKLYEQAITKLEGEIQALKVEVEELKKTKAVAAAATAPKQSAFTVGEGHFDKKEWKKAIFQYKKYKDENPKGKQVAMATYKIGVCFQELGLNKEAKYFYNEVVERYKTSKVASKAKYRLKNIK